MIPAQISRLIPRLASPFDGEVVATRNAIDRLLRAEGLDWHSLALACSASRPVGVVSTTPTRSATMSFGDLARAARDLDRGRLTPRERGFVLEMCAKGFGFRPSPRQAAWLDDILSKLQRRAAA